MVARLHVSSILAITYEDCQNVTASDSAKVPGNRAAGFGCDVAGTIAFITVRGTTVTRTCLAGLIYNIAITQIKATGTTATGLFCVYVNPYDPSPA